MENNKDLHVERQFNCDINTLYQAWTDPEQLKQWWKPMGHELTEVINELTEGGHVKYVFKEDTLTIDGQYEKVQENELLSYSWNWHLAVEPIEDAEYKLRVEFTRDGHGSKLSVTQEGFNSAESVHPHHKGWEQGLEQLHFFLSGNIASNSGSEQANDSLQGEQKPPISGYNETPEQQKVGGG